MEGIDILLYKTSRDGVRRHIRKEHVDDWEFLEAIEALDGIGLNHVIHAMVYGWLVENVSEDEAADLKTEALQWEFTLWRSDAPDEEYGPALAC